MKVASGNNQFELVMARLITVFGATGTQGGSLVRAVLKDGTFRVRGITRNVGGEGAKSLADQGVEMVQASLDDVLSLENALAGSYGVFAMTNYWAHFDQAKEVQQGKNVVDASKKAGVQHLVFSGQQSSLKLTGKPCANMDGKAEIEEYMFNSGLDTATTVRFAGYMENLFAGSPPKATEQEGVYMWHIPMEGKPMDMISTSASGPAVLGIFKNPDKYRGKAIGLSGDRKTIQEYCDVMSTIVAPKKVLASPVTAEAFGNFGFPKAKELGQMFAFYQSDQCTFDIGETKILDSETKDFETYLEENKDALLALFH